ncbi:MAG: efflux RND transporter permease subunit [Myxococcales bacterium]|nr:efflux RND transporter permease subunit [Myxococcales bacterium]
MTHTPSSNGPHHGSWLDPLISFCLKNRLVVILLLFFLVGWGAMVAPFDWKVGDLPRAPVPVDAIPDLGENQQIVFTRWGGRSPQDVEDQITYPLTTALMGLPHLKTIRSFSYFGFSTIYLIFAEQADFYQSRSRILEKLNSLPNNTLPKDAKPTLGPDATGLGQIFWYTLEGRDEKGQPAGGWDLQELRRIQDWYVRFSLQSVQDVSEVASIGGFVQTYQIDVDPERLRIYGLTLASLYRAIQASNQEIGARTIEINRTEYVIRARGYLKSIQDLGLVVLRAKNGAALYLRDVAKISLGPDTRRGALDKDGAEAVGGVVVARYGSNPLAVIQHLKAKIAEISPGLPQKKLRDGRVSKVTVVPFYDRAKLIKETLGTLEEAISLEILVTILVVILMLMHLRSALLIAGTLPVAVLVSFIAMKLARVDANIVALSGIAIAIGTMVDMGIVLSEQIYQSFEEAPPEEPALSIVFRATSQVAGAVLTAVSTTVVSFLPVFTMEAAEGKLFRPLAWTKTFALLAALLVALTLLPTFALIFLKKPNEHKEDRKLTYVLLGIFLDLGLLGGGLWLRRILPEGWGQLAATLLIGYGIWRLVLRFLNKTWQDRLQQLAQWVVAFAVMLLLTRAWMPLEAQRGFARNALFVGSLIGGLIGFFAIFRIFYAKILRFFLRHKMIFLSVPLFLILLGANIWLGFDRVFGWLPPTLARVGVPQKTLVSHPWWVHLRHEIFPGLKKEFMPDLDEGSFLLMPTTMPNASIGEALDVLKKLDMAVRSIPEVELVVGKLGRAESALDPAPISMFENIIHYKAKYRITPEGRRVRQWRPHIQTPKDIWDEIVKATRLPGTTSAPLLQPISARIVMLQSGMRAPMGIKLKGPDLKTLEKVAIQMEKLLKKVPQISAATVVADRVVGKPYLEFIIDRRAIARYGLQIADVQRTIQMAIGGSKVTTTVEGRERYDVILRYPRELRNNLTALQRIMVATPTGAQIPLFQLAQLRYVRGPQVIKSEDTFLVAYIVFDRDARFGEIETVEAARDFLLQKQKAGALKLPAGVSYTFAGSYQNQIRAEKRLLIVLPLSLFLIFLLLYLQFRRSSTTLFIFSGILLAWSGGFLMLWFYAQPWFLDVTILGASMREVFHIQPFQMSVAVWVGFIALFGIASDDGVVIATYLDQSFQDKSPQTIEEIREATIEAGERRIRACLMTTATTLLALLPVLSSSGRGADIMIPMAIPSFGGMLIELLTLFLVPVLYCWREEHNIRSKRTPERPSPAPIKEITPSTSQEVSQ